MRGIDGRTAIVTGGSGGIGSVVAARLAAEGALVRVLDSAPADDVVRLVREAGGSAECAVVDVRDEPAVRAQLAAAGWRPDLLVNVAGVFAWEEVPPAGRSDDWERTLAVNLTGAQICCAAAAATMCERGFGRIAVVCDRHVHVVVDHVLDRAGPLGLGEVRGPADVGVHRWAARRGVVRVHMRTR